MGNIYSGSQKSDYEKLPILSCALWKSLYKDDGVYFCYSDRILDFLSFTLTFVFVYQIWVYRSLYKIPWKDPRVIILFLCCFSSFYTFCHYSLMHGVLKGYTYFIIAISRILIFSLVFYYFCMKASVFIQNKKYKLFTLKLIVLSGTVLSSGTGLFIDYYIIPEDLQGNGLRLCHTHFIMLEETVDIVVVVLFIIIFYQIKQSIVSEKRFDAI